MPRGAAPPVGKRGMLHWMMPACSHPVARVSVMPALLAGVACSQVPVEEVETFQEPSQGWVEVWRDDFDGPAQSPPDTKRWNVEIRPMGQNMELDYDTNDRKNSFLDGSGNLVFQALQEQYVDDNGVQSAQPYTSARLNTQGKLDQTYGKFE